MPAKTTCVLAFYLSLCSLLSSCDKEPRSFYSGVGKKPIYAPLSALRDIRNEAPQPIGQSGTIFLRDSLLFLLDLGKGIHVYDIRDSLNTVNLTFFKIPAVTDFILSGSVLYADCWTDLVAIDISDLFQIRETNRISNVLTPPMYPPQFRGPFECVDETKGALIGWEDAVLDNVKCHSE